MQIKAEFADSPERTAATTSAQDTFAIQAENLVRRFGETEALSRVSIKIRKGEFFSLLGPSGCGKTTLLRIIAGLDFPDEGSLKIGGRDAAPIPAHQRPVNTVFQSYALFPHLTVRDNVAFGLRMKKVPASEIRDRVDKIMALVQIMPFADRKPAQLSGGQRQRVALARALVNEPEVLLLDEPLGALDLKLRKELQVELSQLQRRLGITFILVTHDQEEALVMSDRIAVMNAGKIEQMDGVEELYERPRTRFVAKFLGSCNLIEATITKADGNQAIATSRLGELQFDLASVRQKIIAGDKVTLAIRPEKIGLLPTDTNLSVNQFRAQIEEVIYSGAETQYRLRIGEEELNACALNCRSGSQGFEIGNRVVVSLPTDALLVLND